MLVFSMRIGGPMTLCEVVPGSGTTAGRLAAAQPPAPGPAVSGWAVVEIRPDETWGRLLVVPAPGAAEAVEIAAAASTPQPGDLGELAPMIEAHLGALHVANGDLSHAVDALTRGATARTTSQARDNCLGALAHVEAIRGDLRRAAHHAGQVRRTSPVRSPGAAHAHLARAWIALERGEWAEVRRRLDGMADTLPPDHDPWLVTSRLLLEATLLLATGQPDAATRLLAADGDVGGPGDRSDWLSELLEILRAEALLASGESQRALAAVTPMPLRASVRAAVVAAAARRSIGDVRGAQAVLGGAVEHLERAPLAVQIDAWLLESRLAEDRGKHDRARLLTDRALKLATAERMRRPLIREWRWLRAFVDRDPALLRSHREFLSTCRPRTEALPTHGFTDAGPGLLLGASLTEREGEVLDLVAQMYSTDEIAAALFVSSNTVKTHLKGIFGKLCVNRRADAVRRGRQLGLC